MNQVQKAAERELNRAISRDEQANTRYYQILRRFVSGDTLFPEEELHQPEVILDASGLKEIDAAWLTLNNSGKKLRNAYMKLYVAYL